MRKGLNKDGQVVEGDLYAAQRILDAVATPLGSVFMCRNYGSSIHELLDQNMTDTFYIKLCHEMSNVFSNEANGLDDLEFQNIEINENNLINIIATYKHNNKKIEVAYDKNSTNSNN